MIRLVLLLLAVLYPFGIYFGVTYLSPQVVTALFVFVILVRVLADDFALRWKILGVGLAAFLCVLHWVMKDDYASLRFYPVILNSVMLFLFVASLLRGTPLIEVIARKRGMDVGPHNLNYLRNLTIVWVGFFIFNIIVSSWTAVSASMDTWLLYNGFVVYVLMGCLAVGELITRQLFRRRIERGMRQDA